MFLKLQVFFFLAHFIYLSLVPVFRLLFPPLHRYYLLIFPDLRRKKFFLISLQFLIKSTNFLHFLNPWIHLGVHNSPLHVHILGQVGQFYSLILFKSNLILSPHPRIFFHAVSDLQIFPLQLRKNFPSLPQVSRVTTIFSSDWFFLLLCLIFSHFLPPTLRLHSTASSASSSIFLSPLSVIICLLLLFFQIYSIFSSHLAHYLGYCF